MKVSAASALIFLSLLPCHRLPAAVLLFGDKDVLGTGSYAADPAAGATLEGLEPGEVTFGSAALEHPFPFAPSSGEFPGTDRIYAGSAQTASHEGYSAEPGRLAGPQVIVLDYSSAVAPLEVITSFTLGIAADDFQFPVLGQPFTARINGAVSPELTAALNALSQTGPVTRFFSIGLPVDILAPDRRLTLEIDGGGDGGDGWAVDFLTAGVTVRPVPEPSSAVFALAGAAGLGTLRRRRPLR